MTEHIAQLTFDGRAIGGVKFALAPLSIEELLPGLTWDEIADLHHGDMLELSMRVVVQDAGADEKLDRVDGTGSGTLKRSWKLVPIREGLQVTASLSREAREQAWKSDHGAVG